MTILFLRDELEDTEKDEVGENVVVVGADWIDAARSDMDVCSSSKSAMRTSLSAATPER